MNAHDIEEEILICTLDGYQYFLGPEYDDELDWENAKKWCESIGEGYELPNRLVMLAICMNEDTAALLTGARTTGLHQKLKNSPPTLGFRCGIPENRAFKVTPVSLIYTG